MIEISFSPTFHAFPIALGFRNVGHHATIPQQFAGCPRIKGPIRIEQGTVVVQTTAFQVLEELLELLFKLKGISMLTRNNLGGGKNVATRIRYWQDIAGLGFLSALIGDVFAPFFAALWLPSRFSSDTFSSPLIVRTLASKRRCNLPSRLHFRK